MAPKRRASLALGIFDKREHLYGENIWQIIALPLRVFFSGQDDNPQYFDGVLTPMLILFLPWVFKGKWLEEKKILAGFALLLLLYAVFLVDLRIRYILAVRAATGHFVRLWRVQCLSQYQTAQCLGYCAAFIRGVAWILSVRNIFATPSRWRISLAPSAGRNT